MAINKKNCKITKNDFKKLENNWRSKNTKSTCKKIKIKSIVFCKKNYE